MSDNYAALVREEKYERYQYHDCTDPPLMVSMFSALQRPINTIENIIDWSFYYIIYQWVTNSSCSHSIVNEPFLKFNIDGLLVGICSNTMKNCRSVNSRNGPKSSDTCRPPASASFALQVIKVEGLVASRRISPQPQNFQRHDEMPPVHSEYSYWPEIGGAHPEAPE